MTTDMHDAKVQHLQQQFHTHAGSGSLSLKKKTSNLFRNQKTGRYRLDVSSLNHVLDIDTDSLTITAEGMTTFEDIVNESLAHGLIPLVVPELKTITIGGAIAGMAIESSSFRYGLVHESITEMEILTGTGEVVVCTPTNEHKDLFFGLPNSYGTLGYVLKATIKARRAPNYIYLRHIPFTSPEDCFKAVDQICKSKKYDGETVSFIDGTAFRPNQIYLTIGIDTDEAPYLSDYTYKQIYYRSIPKNSDDYLTIHDYIWRWDTDWFWCSKNMFADRPLARRILGRRRLGSRTYSRIMRFEAKYQIYGILVKLFGQAEPKEDVIQDVEIPIQNAPSFLQQFDQQIGMHPVWICPTKSVSKRWPYPLYPMDGNQLYINFGFWDSIPAHGNPEDAYFNKKVEQLVSQLDGMKSLYSTSFYNKEDFERIYNYAAYKKIKATYDPDSRLGDLYDKCSNR
jgi:FAD/FMN-containing dehydrogenase